VVSSNSAITFGGWELVYLLTAASGTYLMIGTFLRIVESKKLHWLAVYCLLIGTAAIVFV